MNRWRWTLLSLTIVAAFQAPLAAAVAITEDVPVPGGTAALARALGIDPVPDRSRFLFELTRLIYDNADGRNQVATAFLQSLAQPANRRKPTPAAAADGRSELVPVPLSAELWSSAVFHRKVSRDELVMAIVSDRTASLVCHGLAALDDQTLQFIAEHSGILTRLYERSAPAFAAFSSSLHIRANSVVPPGAVGHVQGEPLRQAQGERDAVSALWESVVLEPVTRPDRFVSQLFELNDGRLAYLYDTIGQVDPPRRAFALGFWMKDATQRAARFKVLTTVGTTSYREWHLRTLPFGRSPYDLAMTLLRIDVGPTGAPAPPASGAWWSRVFSGNDVTDESARQTRGAEDDPIDAAWLTEAVGDADVRQRGGRLDQIAFGQRVFGTATADERGDVFVALRAFSRYRMLMVTLDRIGIRKPAVYAGAARHANRLSTIDGHRGFVALAQFQGALALVARMASVRTIDVPGAEAFIEHLVALPVTEDGRYAGAIARWLQADVAARLPVAFDIETTVLTAMSGPSSGEGTPAARVTWEGQQYRLDLGAAELRRLQRVREKQEGLPLDVALDVAAAGRTLATDKVSIDDIQAVVTRLTSLISDVPKRSRQNERDNAPIGLAAAPSVRDALRKAIDELTKAVRNKDVKRAARESETLSELSDELLANALLSIAYAADVGDPDGAVLLAEDVSRRHDFGFGAKDPDLRIRTAWAIPRQDSSPGLPWHITGSLLGLDIGLAPLALRRVNVERVIEAPKLTSNERDAFALSVSVMNPFMLRDADRDVIAGAIERGRARALALRADGGLDTLADEIAMESWRRRAMRWTLDHEPDAVLSMLSLTELLTLGGGRADQLQAWGMSMLASEGCVCSRLALPGRASLLWGRPQLGLTASVVADLNLHVAVTLKELDLPAALAKMILSGAMQDFVDEVKPTDDADWLTLARTARLVPRDRVEDYIAAATAGGPLVPDTGRPIRQVP